ncbi:MULTISPECIES: hypothetical protein [unclassified Pseudofrankia]|uniref:hypothetical protein n=1 Tax=unclassified Pseudofrankia TaxID=2994372 RepID=UPI0008D937F0|nr:MULTISPECIES: hypothetical protein [unclassified Pseudofrankia]MDT3441435.1 hypothetical protein [Pseudofrankia sp. BMG5.37]OHV48878.1 hypothetical protein BCD48_13495 [Pseudofrankia sp. BMG5.36]
MSDLSTDDATVRTLLAIAGLKPSEEEIASLVASYPAVRASIDALYEVADVRYEEPGLIFPAVPTM